MATRKRKAKADGGLVKSILEWCATKPHHVWAWRANSGTPKVLNRDGSVGFFKSGEPGTPDILGIVLVPDHEQLSTRAVFFGIEAKRTEGKRRPSQVKWHDKATKFLVPVVTAHSISEAIAFVDQLRSGKMKVAT